MSASVAVYRNIYTEDRFRQTYGTEDKPVGQEKLRERVLRRCRCSQVSCYNLLKERVPIFNWLPKYRLKKWILGDAVAGLTVGILHIPQGNPYRRHIFLNAGKLLTCKVAYFSPNSCVN